MSISTTISATKPTEARYPQFGAEVRRQRLDDSIQFGPKTFQTKVDVDLYDDVVLLGGARTPFGKVGGSLRDVSSMDLLKIAMKGAMDKSGVKPEDVSQLIAGNIIANNEQAAFLPRNVELSLGIPQSSTALGVNRLCGTGFEALRQAANQLTHGGEDTVILTGGVENMSRTPVMDNQRMLVEGYLDAIAKKGGLKGKAQSKIGALMQRFQKKPFENPLQKGLTDPLADIMIGTADNLASLEGLTRDEVDAFGARSQVRAAMAQSAGLFDDEIVPVRKEDLSASGAWKSRLQKGAAMVSRDEHIRFALPANPADLEKSMQQSIGKMKKLEVINKNRQDAIHTAATSSGVVDGAAAIAVSTGQFAKEKHYPVLAKLKAVAIAGCPAGLMGAGPIPAIRGVMKAAGLTVDDIDLFEVNEAFAGQAMTVARQVGIPMDKFNVDGGAIALGHPLAASGSRIALHAANRLKQEGKRFAVVSACIGGGQGIAALIENPDAVEKPKGSLYPPDKNCWVPPKK